MTRKILIAATALGALTLAGCLGTFEGFELTKDDPPRAELEQMKAECDSRGGSLHRTGMFRIIACITPLDDAGKACRTGSDCEGECLVEDTGRSCQSISPMFGCYSYVETDGSVQEICVD